MNHEDLYNKSIDVIIKNQHLSGAYIACPSFPSYNYSWFRDSSYIAYSMDLIENFKSSEQFHSWAVNNINKRETEIRRLMNGDMDNYEEVLHTRYQLNGHEGADSWENFQLDGFGVWLWSLYEHVQLSGRKITKEIEKAVELVSGYLSMLWQKPCYDCWEENRNEMHIYTLSCIYRGLKSSDSLLASNTFANTTSQIKKWILEEGVISGSLCKFKGNGAIDSSLLGVHFPNDVFGNKEAIMRKTVDRIHSELYKAGGLHRYAEDSYYGGGIWILLTAWLGIWFFDDGNPQAAEEILDWIGIKADKDGHLAEQYADSLNNSTFLPIWNKKWGESANPLLWSHAMYIILHKKLYPGI